MDEYLEKSKIINLIEHNDKVYHYADRDKENIVHDTIQTLCRVIIEAEAADVQPVDQWISVDDRLPEIDKEVLVYYQYYWGKGDIAEECGISKYYDRGKWSTLHIPIDSEVLYWQPLPEPPLND